MAQTKCGVPPGIVIQESEYDDSDIDQQTIRRRSGKLSMFLFTLSCTMCLNSTKQT